MKINYLLFLAFFLLINSIIQADCIDDKEFNDPSPEYAAFFQKEGWKHLTANEQKITTTLQGITFDSNYDNGSLVSVASNGTNNFNLGIYTEYGTIGSAKYWFRFRMTGVAGKTITLNIDHSENLRPVISFDGSTWRRMTSTEAPSSSKLVLTFSGTQNYAEAAFFFPLGYLETYKSVSDIVRGDDNITTKVIGQSDQGRDLWLVEVTDKSVPDTNKHRVWIHTRAHAGEATAVHTMIGFLQQITEDSSMGRRLRKHFIFDIVPTLNVDGVYAGYTRWDTEGNDLERDWCTPTTLLEVLAIRGQINQFMSGPNPIQIALNLHSTKGPYADSFFFKHLQPSVTSNFELIQQNYIDYFDNATTLFNNLSAQTSQLAACMFVESYYWNNWGENIMAMTYEGHFQKRLTDNLWITDTDYRDLGHALAIALIEYFAIPIEISGMQWEFYKD